MAFSHLINCILLMYAPLFIVQKAKNLSDYNTFNICLYAALASLASSFCKIFLMASISLWVSELTSNIFILEVTQNIFNLVDCYGIYQLQKSKQSQQDNVQIRVLSIAIGWILAENTILHAFNIIPQASQDEFTWDFIMRAFTSNIDFFETIILVGLILTICKNSKKMNYNYMNDLTIIFLMVFKTTLIPTLVKILSGQLYNKFTPEQTLIKTLLGLGFVILGRTQVKL